MPTSRDTIAHLLDAFYSYFESDDQIGAEQILASDWRNHPADEGRSADVEGFLGGARDLRTAFAGLTVTRQATVMEGELAVCRSILAGTQVGEFGGYPASGRPAWFAAMDMHRIEDGRIKETWHFERLETLGDETPGDIAAIAAWPLQAEGPTAHSGESLRFRP